MFKHIGNKLKYFAIAFVCVGILISFVSGIVMCTRKLILYGILVMVLGSIFSWLGSLVLYGFGELINNSKLIRNKLYDLDPKTDEMPDDDINIVIDDEDISQ